MSYKQFKKFFELVQKELSEGFGPEQYIPIEIVGRLFHVVIFKPERNMISFGLFLREREFPRKKLLVYSSGTVVEDKSVIIPQEDLTNNEPAFGKMKDHQIMEIVADEVIALMEKAKQQQV